MVRGEPIESVAAAAAAVAAAVAVAAAPAGAVLAFPPVAFAAPAEVVALFEGATAELPLVAVPTNDDDEVADLLSAASSTTAAAPSPVVLLPLPLPLLLPALGTIGLLRRIGRPLSGARSKSKTSSGDTTRPPPPAPPLAEAVHGEREGESGGEKEAAEENELLLLLHPPQQQVQSPLTDEHLLSEALLLLPAKLSTMPKGVPAGRSGEKKRMMRVEITGQTVANSVPAQQQQTYQVKTRRRPPGLPALVLARLASRKCRSRS